MESLEALEDLKSTINALSTFLQRSSKKEYQDLKIIEKDLKRLKKLEEENSKLLIDNERLDIRICTLEEIVNINRKINELATKAVNENEELKQVIDVLKEFHFKLNETRHSSTGFEIWTDSLLESVELSQEQYELLKQYLGKEKNNDLE